MGMLHIVAPGVEGRNSEITNFAATQKTIFSCIYGNGS